MTILLPDAPKELSPMDWWAVAEVVTVPLVFILGRYSARYRFIRIKRRYKQNVNEFIRGRS